MFDLNKDLDDGSAVDLLKDQFFTKKKDTTLQTIAEPESGTHQEKKATIKTLLKAKTHEATMDYLKNLTPSGIELELITLGNFEVATSNSQNYVTFTHLTLSSYVYTLTF